MPHPLNYGATRADRRFARETKRATKAAKRELRREARHDQPKGNGVPIDWEASTTGRPAQFPSAYDDSNPIVAGVGRTISRGL
jgi:hypothetical protein